MALAACALAPSIAAQGVADLVPGNAAHCGISDPPATAGIAATPGGFLMVYPRNDALTGDFTGCKVLWVVDVDHMSRLATLYFERGALVRALARDTRDPKGSIEVACDLRSGLSLLPNAERRATDASCLAEPREDLYALPLATWPRRCLVEPDAAICKRDPR
jgi:hypothetical protein